MGPGLIENKVEQSGLVVIDLHSLLPQADKALLDLKPFLFNGILLKEKEFRESIGKTDWQAYRDKDVAVFCSSDALIPNWAYMLIVACLQPYARITVIGDEQALDAVRIRAALAGTGLSPYKDKKVLVKGCGDVPPQAYAEISALLLPVVQSLMYGEPCSTVPVYKRK